MRTPLRAALAGVVATLVLFSAADLIARAFGPPSAPLLALGQTIIPLAPAGLIKPVIDLLGHNDKLFLILTTGLGALVLGGLIGRLAFRRLRMATVLLSAAGLVPVLVILIRAESSVVDIIPTLIGLALGLLVFRLLIAAGAGQPTLRSGQPTLRSGEADGGRTESGQSPATPSRRRFFVITGVIGAAGAAAVAAGQTVASLTLDAGAAVAKLVLPKPATTAPPIPASAHPEVKGLAPFVTDPKDFYRIDTALAPPVVDPQEWSMRIHGMVESEVTLTMDDLLRSPPRRAPHHAHLRLQPRRR